ncbi:substrate-binding periplasmic protein [Aquipseudomonas guryensis]|uniref:Transporter substrate-binding domain-containing protein n=1 Tax=Aquipseudomonas guryensis TaxID=2759165 RepID=A0A7W4DEH2_9GAMM|nr:transporter substrate-binding domain-containing protein [Pseudomonas guryensis]MBB1521117.1 transporter substrate-binding domain-containing protein [Pseudomonas guryensis]
MRARRKPAIGPWLTAFLLSGLLGTVQAEALGVLRYPRAPSGEEYRHEYALAQLQLALNKVGSHLQPRPSKQPMEQERALLSLEEGGSVDVVWSMTSIERERRLLPVRIPLDKGLYGWRIALLRADRAQLLRRVRSLDDLQALSAGQGHDWPDTAILRHNGLPVVVTSSYDSLFRMLDAGRFDYFPRAVIEIWDEARHRSDAAITVDRHLLLHYPTALYFFFSPHNPELANSVRRGMQLALADGSFDRLFMQHYGANLQQVKFAERRVLELDNPLLPSATPLQQRELWFSPADLARQPGGQTLQQ